MRNFKIAAAQIPSEKGSIDKNIQRHIETINIAVKHQVSVITFPELSLTGYEPELAGTLALTKNDDRLDLLLSAALENNIWVIAGAPLKYENHLHIGSIIFSPNGSISTYSKINLHPGEDLFFRAGKTLKILEVQNHKIALAICADTKNPEHVKSYADFGVSIYAAGVLITKDGYESDTEKLATYAKQHNMLVVMANHNHPTGGWNPIGKSATWGQNGLLSTASEVFSSLVISHQIDGDWVSEVVRI